MGFTVPNQYRLRSGEWGSDDTSTDCGAFFVPNKHARSGPPLKVIAASGEGWEHVSVSLPTRCPTWEEMCLIKRLFWTDVCASCRYTRLPSTTSTITRIACTYGARSMRRFRRRLAGWSASRQARNLRGLHDLAI